METLLPLLLVILPAILAAAFGADSRPADADRPTRWYPAQPRD